MNDLEPSGSTLLFFALISCVVLWIAKKRLFFSLPFSSPWKIPIHLWHVLVVFGIYFGVSNLIIPFLAHIGRMWIFHLPEEILPFISLLNFCNSLLIGSALWILFRKSWPSLGKALWRETPQAHWKEDGVQAIFAWLVGFPLVIFIGQILDWSVVHLFHAKALPEQLAVQLLKLTFSSPFHFAITLSSVVFFAPLIEELLFRGCLQSWMRNHIGSRQSILVTALLFAFFHYSPEQGLSNIPIVGSLFTLALFLSFLYEKQRSLLSPILLHSLFNTISVLNLYFLGGFPNACPI